MPKVIETQSMLLQLILVFVIFSGFLENGSVGITSASFGKNGHLLTSLLIMKDLQS